jgi:restriction endonuclease S subunit
MVGPRSKKNTDSRKIGNDNLQLGNYESDANSLGLKVMIKQNSELIKHERDDFDYYEPTLELNEYAKKSLIKLEDMVNFSKESRDPADDKTSNFKYVEISSIDTETGEIQEYSTIPTDDELIPSRARKIIHEGDIIISTVRPTRKAIAMIPKDLENQICSTGFEVVHPKSQFEPDYVLYILRSSLVAKQFGKFASGSSYPAILDKHIKMTQVPVPIKNTQKTIANKMRKTNKDISKLKIKISKIVKQFEKESDEQLKK